MDNREKLVELSEYLYEKETITGEEFMEILNA
jgi:cell division protease FtsH